MGSFRVFKGGSEVGVIDQVGVGGLELDGELSSKVSVELGDGRGVGNQDVAVLSEVAD